MKGVRCRYCGRLYEEGRSDCESCGALYEEYVVEAPRAGWYGQSAVGDAIGPSGLMWPGPKPAPRLIVEFHM